MLVTGGKEVGCAGEGGGGAEGVMGESSGGCEGGGSKGQALGVSIKK